MAYVLCAGEYSELMSWSSQAPRFLTVMATATWHINGISTGLTSLASFVSFSYVGAMRRTYPMSARYLNKQIGIYLRLFFLKNAMLAIKFGQSHLHIGRFEFSSTCRVTVSGRHAQPNSSAFFFFAASEAVISPRECVPFCHFPDGLQLPLSACCIQQFFSGSKGSFNDGIALGSTILKSLYASNS